MDSGIFHGGHKLKLLNPRGMYLFFFSARNTFVYLICINLLSTTKSTVGTFIKVELMEIFPYSHSLFRQNTYLWNKKHTLTCQGGDWLL